jgi:hypothetical protein
MFWFVLPLIAGFTSNAASAFTSLYSEKWGKIKGSTLLPHFVWEKTLTTEDTINLSQKINFGVYLV